MEIIELPVILPTELKLQMKKDGAKFRFDPVKRQWYMSCYFAPEYPEKDDEYKATEEMLNKVEKLNNDNSS